MLKDLAVLLPVDRPAGALIDCAVSLASLFESHLDGVACVYQTLNPMIASEAAAVVMAAEYDTSVEKAAIVLDQFEIAARRLGIPHDAKSTFNVSYAATRAVTEMSRLYDLNIVAQPDRSNPSQADFLSETVLFGSGRPVLMVPYITRSPIGTDRVLICWDGGVPAARAVHDAIPFLRKAKTIDIVAVNESEDATSEISSTALIAHRRFQYSQRHIVPGCRLQYRSDRDGRIWSLKITGIYPRGHDARHVRVTDRAGFDFTLNRSAIAKFLERRQRTRR